MRRKVRSGQWRRCGRGVYFVDDRPFTAAARIRAEVWARGSLAAASGLAAAWWLGLTTSAPGLVEVTVPRNSHGRSGPGAQVRRRDLCIADVIEHRGLRVTSPSLTVLEAAAWASDGPAVMDAALRNRVTLTELQRTHERNRGRHGSATARKLLESAAGGARSEAERVAVRLLIAAGITGWQVNFPVGRYIVDIAFPAQRVAIEIDGWAFHSSHKDFQQDRSRQNKLALQGWQVLRFTWLDLTQRPQRVLAEINAAISAR